ncbi:MAG: nicotinate (nicotinamide) nucleotide adenylyltransferase [Synechococcus sp.]
MSSLSELPSSCRQVGILGGTFNPVHNGHVAIAEAAMQQFGLDATLWIPAGIPPHKPLAGGASNQDRLEMVKLAIADRPHFYWSDIELQRQGRSFAVETIEQLQDQYPHIRQWYWIIGADAIADLPNWHRAADITRLCTWIVAPRPDTPRTGLLEKVQAILPHLQAEWLDCEEMEVSSSDIRQALQQERQAIDVVPAAVASYMQAHQLYASPELR